MSGIVPSICPSCLPPCPPSCMSAPVSTIAMLSEPSALVPVCSAESLIILSNPAFASSSCKSSLSCIPVTGSKSSSIPSSILGSL